MQLYSFSSSKLKNPYFQSSIAEIPSIFKKILFALRYCSCMRELHSFIVFVMSLKGRRSCNDKTEFLQTINRYESSAKCQRSSTIEFRQQKANQVWKARHFSKNYSVLSFRVKLFYYSSLHFNFWKAKVIWQIVWQFGATVSLFIGGNAKVGSITASLIWQNYSPKTEVPLATKLLQEPSKASKRPQGYAPATKLLLCQISCYNGICSKQLQQMVLSFFSQIRTTILPLMSWLSCWKDSTFSTACNSCQRSQQDKFERKIWAVLLKVQRLRGSSMFFECSMIAWTTNFYKEKLWVLYLKWAL